MPTIEIVSVKSKSLKLNQSDFEIAIRIENILRSHRGLFYDFLIKQTGTIIHIGNPEMKNKDSGFFAGKLLDHSVEKNEINFPSDEDNLTSNRGANQCFIFKFKDIFKNEIDTILKSAIDNSEINKVYFLSDFQFGPENQKQEIIYSISEFWQRHDSQGLEYNKLYELYSY